MSAEKDPHRAEVKAHLEQLPDGRIRLTLSGEADLVGGLLLPEVQEDVIAGIRAATPGRE